MRTHAPGPVLVVGTGACVVAFSTTHPLTIAAVLVTALALLWAAPGPRRGVLAIGAVLGLGVALLNPFVQASGDLIVIELPDVPIFDAQVTAEEIVAGLTLGGRAAAVTILLMALLALADPDRLLALAGRLAPRSALAASVGARMVPTLRRDATALVETARLRGHSPTQGRWSERVRTAGTLALPLVGSALERSLDVAEAMTARGYGAGRPTRRPRAPWRQADRLGLAAGLALCAVGALTIATDVGDYAFYPTLGPLAVPSAAAAAALVALAGWVAAAGYRR